MSEDEGTIELGGRVSVADAVEMLECYARLDEIRRRLPYADFKALLDLSEYVQGERIPGYVKEVSSVCADCDALGRFFIYPGGNTFLDRRLHDPDCPAGLGIVDWQLKLNVPCVRDCQPERHT